MRNALWAVALLACGGEPAPDAGIPRAEPAAPPTLEEAWGMDVASLGRAANDLGALAAEQAGRPEGVANARRAAELARVLALRDPEGADWIARARAWLTEASRRRSVAGACEAALELARLEARDAGDSAAAYRVAFRTSLRFDDEACVAEAERMLAVLAPWRPPASELAAIEADPHEGDPSALDAPVAAPDEPAAAAARWAAARAGEGAATLEALAVYGQREGDEARSVRVVLRFDRVVAFEHGEAPAQGSLPRRTWLELPGVRPGEGLASALPVGVGGLLEVRTHVHDAGVRVTFDVEARARFRAFVLPEPFRVVLDVESGELRADGPVRTIVLDPGHGGDDFGTRAAGLRESDLTLDLARRVRTLLARDLPRARVILTRESDVFVSLEQRAAMANAVSADLFLSIHLNAADEPIRRGGVTTFVLDTSGDRQALRLAARENGTSVAEVGDLSRIIASLHREDQVRASRALAEQVHRATLRAGRRVLPRLHDRGVRSALFHVLVGVRMPAALIEASFLTTDGEAAALATPEYRQALAEGIAAGIVRWAAR
ncbi:MAG TPA: N-acetylmuramoyl-L-alanine amidase [Sandaracinaceae bacterium]